MGCRVFIATSLDGYIARPDGGLDWLPSGEGSSPGDDHGYTAFMADIDALVMGRKTYDIVLGFGSWPYTKPVFVLTHSTKPLPVPKGGQCEAISGTPQEVVAKLAKRGLHNLYVDGGATITQFLAAGLIESMIITRIPVLIGAGIPLFGALPNDIPFRHVATRSYPSGLVQSEYAAIEPTRSP